MKGLMIALCTLVMLQVAPALAATAPAGATKTETRDSVRASMKDEIDKLKLQQKDQTTKLRSQQKEQRDKLKADQHQQMVKLKADQKLRWQKFRAQVAVNDQGLSAGKSGKGGGANANP